MGRLRSRAALVATLAALSCQGPKGSVEFYSSESYTFTAADRRAIEEIWGATAAEARPLLVGLPTDLQLKVYVGQKVIDLTGEAGSSYGPGTVEWIVDPKHPGGVLGVVKVQLSATLLHELHHLARGSAGHRDSLLDAAVTEGLATAFERDRARVAVPWGEYPTEVSGWVQAVRELPPDAERGPWMFRHPDGRRWIAYKVGTYLVDCATRASGQDPAQLVHASTAELLRWAEQSCPSRAPGK